MRERRYCSVEERVELGRDGDPFPGCRWYSRRCGGEYGAENESASPKTLGLLAEFGYQWSGDHNDRELPDIVDTAAGPKVRIMLNDLSEFRRRWRRRGRRHGSLVPGLVNGVHDLGVELGSAVESRPGVPTAVGASRSTCPRTTAAASRFSAALGANAR